MATQPGVTAADHLIIIRLSFHGLTSASSWGADVGLDWTVVEKLSVEKMITIVKYIYDHHPDENWRAAAFQWINFAIALHEVVEEERGRAVLEGFKREGK